jgi:hypothetical protein
MTSHGSGKDIRHCFAGDPIEAFGARAAAAPSLALQMTAWRDFRREHVATLELHPDAAPPLGCDRREIADAEFMGLGVVLADRISPFVRAYLGAAAVS